MNINFKNKLTRIPKQQVLEVEYNSEINKNNGQTMDEQTKSWRTFCRGI